jgi:membrane-associated phospholipid phosphatase
MNISGSILFLAISIIISFNNSFGQNNKTSPFKTDYGTEAILLGVGAATSLATLAIQLNLDSLTPEQIAELDKMNVNNFDRSAIGQYQSDYLGDVLLYSSYLLPLTFLANIEAKNNFGVLALMYSEVILLNIGTNGLLKGLTKRTRPYVYDPQSPLDKTTNIDARLSFYSGHTSTVASNYFFTASVLNEYVDNNTTKILIWSAAALVPAVTAFSRVNTHWHFPSDVIVGYIVGAAIGYLIPLIHKSDADDNDSLVPLDNQFKPLIGLQVNF